MTDNVLSAEQIESFVEYGYVRVAECFMRADAQPWLDEAWVRLERGGGTFIAPDSVAPVARLLEQAVPGALGVERLDYRPAAPREDVVPERVLRQERMREEEAYLVEASS